MIQPHGGKLISREMSPEKAKHFDGKGMAKHEISAELARDLENIATGVYSPLTGFLNSDDFSSVVNESRLITDDAWTIPIVLDMDPAQAKGLGRGDQVLLTEESQPRAVLTVEEVYTWNKKDSAKKVYKTDSMDHPGVASMTAMKDALVGGHIELISRKISEFEKVYLRPTETRVLFEQKGWKTTVGFQTRNAPHNGHEMVQKWALSFVDGIFINPVIGKKKKGDFTDKVIIDTCQALIDYYYPKERAVMSILPMEMRYAGPREAIHHAIIRKNYGCTHFIVGRDHAGVGKFYGPFEAQDIFADFPDIGITPLFFKSFFYCNKCGSVMNEKTCPHGKEHIVDFSGTKIRNLLLEGKRPDAILMRPEIADIIINDKHPLVE